MRKKWVPRVLAACGLLAAILVVANCRWAEIRSLDIYVYDADTLEPLPGVAVIYSISAVRPMMWLGIPIPVEYRWRRIIAHDYISNEYGVVFVPEHAVKLRMYETLGERLTVNVPYRHNPLQDYRGVAVTTFLNRGSYGDDATMEIVRHVKLANQPEWHNSVGGTAARGAPTFNLHDRRYDELTFLRIKMGSMAKISVGLIPRNSSTSLDDGSPRPVLHYQLDRPTILPADEARGKSICACRTLYRIDDFRSLNEFDGFVEYIEDHVKEGDFIRVPVEAPYGNSREHWFMCRECNGIWRLVYPDLPFKGLWEKVGNP